LARPRSTKAEDDKTGDDKEKDDKTEGDKMEDHRRKTQDERSQDGDDETEDGKPKETRLVSQSDENAHAGKKKTGTSVKGRAAPVAFFPSCGF